MSYFSRLTDIVTCSLTRILKEASDPEAALEQIIGEMEDGLAGLKRSVATATANGERLQSELEEHRLKIGYWTSKAKEKLAASEEGQARLALVRKREVDDLIGGLQQQYDAAVATREHLTTMQKALEARLSEARRKQQELSAGVAETAVPDETIDEATEAISSIDDRRAAQIEDELEALKRELGQS